MRNDASWGGFYPGTDGTLEKTLLWEATRSDLPFGKIHLALWLRKEHSWEGNLQLVRPGKRLWKEIW